MRQTTPSRAALMAPLVAMLALSAGVTSPSLQAGDRADGGLTAAPKRVAVLDRAGLDTVDALGFDVAIVPAPPSGDSGARWPAHLIEKYAQDRYVRLPGGAAEDGQGNPQLDALKAVAPDLIVRAGRTRGGGGDDFAEVAPVLALSTSSASFVDSVAQNVLTLGTAMGQQPRAVEKVQSLLTDVRKLRETAATQGTGLVMFAVGNRVAPQERDGRFGMVYDLVGIRPALPLTPVADGLGSGRPPARGQVDENDPEARAAAAAEQRARQAAQAKYLEDTLALDPDWIFVVDRNAAFGEAQAAEAMAATPAVANSRAWREGKVVYLDQDGDNWYVGIGGLGLLERTVARIQAAFDAHANR